MILKPFSRLISVVITTIQYIYELCGLNKSQFQQIYSGRKHSGTPCTAAVVKNTMLNLLRISSIKNIHPHLISRAQSLWWFLSFIVLCCGQVQPCISSRGNNHVLCFCYCIHCLEHMLVVSTSGLNFGGQKLFGGMLADIITPFIRTKASPFSET